VPNTSRIAVIDDDESVRQATGRLLRSHGYAVATFGSAEDFLQANEDDAWLCVITDIRMPGMSGIELQARLIAAGFRTPIIFMTAFPEESTFAAALAAGAHAYLAKPWREQSLLDLVKSALERPPVPHPAG
jgi:FixJ family two-component response regulator